VYTRGPADGWGGCNYGNAMACRHRNITLERQAEMAGSTGRIVKLCPRYASVRLPAGVAWSEIQALSRSLSDLVRPTAESTVFTKGPYTIESGQRP
jgi:hypothetical protein